MEWTLAELVDRVAVALASGYDGPPNGRVSELPDVRAIRYYTTLGLLDRPAAMRGRTALYGERHLRQLVAIKRLQAAGHSLATIQQQLTGASDTELSRLADGPASAFWRRPPAAPALPIEPAIPAARPVPDAGARPAAPIYQAVPLPGGAIVLIPHRTPLTDADLNTLRAAAAPLDAALARLPQTPSPTQGA